MLPENRELHSASVELTDRLVFHALRKANVPDYIYTLLEREIGFDAVVVALHRDVYPIAEGILVQSRLNTESFRDTLYRILSSEHIENPCIDYVRQCLFTRYAAIVN